MTPTQRRDFALARFAMGPCSGPDRIAGMDALQRIERDFAEMAEAMRARRQSDVTQRVEVGR